MKLTRGNIDSFFKTASAGDSFTISKTTITPDDLGSRAHAKGLWVKLMPDGSFCLLRPSPIVESQKYQVSRQVSRAAARDKKKPAPHLKLLEPGEKTRAQRQKLQGEIHKMMALPNRQRCEARIKGQPWKHETERRARLQVAR